MIGVVRYLLQMLTKVIFNKRRFLIRI